MQRELPPLLTVIVEGTTQVRASGAWLAHVLAQSHAMEAISTALATPNLGATEVLWDLSQISALDHIGAQLIWQAWGKQFPSRLLLNPAHQGLFDRLATISQLHRPLPPRQRFRPLTFIGRHALHFFQHLVGLTELLGQLILDLARLCRHPLRGPWKEISANVYRTGFQAMLITALVGMLIGVVLSYLLALQLRNYGSDLFIVNLLGVSIIRELGPMLAAILIAGRSGSAITAQLGVMRVTEEIDAMRVMGIPVGFRLIMPKVLALAFTMPTIVIWTDVMALLGGILSSYLILDMSPLFFIHKLSDVVELVNFWIGLGKGVAFGILIAVIACHYGLRIKPNTESLGEGTTNSVVVSITAVIIADAIFAVAFNKVGY